MGALGFHTSLFPIRRPNDKGRGVSRVAAHRSAVAAPVGGGPGSIVLPTAFKGNLLEGRWWQRSLPHRDRVHACVFLIKLWLLASEEEGGVQGLHGAGQGIRSWVFKSLGAAAA